MFVAVMGGLRAYVQNLVLKYNSPLTLAAANILIQVRCARIYMYKYASVYCTVLPTNAVGR